MIILTRKPFDEFSVLIAQCLKIRQSHLSFDSLECYTVNHIDIPRLLLIQLNAPSLL